MSDIKPCSVLLIEAQREPSELDTLRARLAACERERDDYREHLGLCMTARDAAIQRAALAEGKLRLVVQRHRYVGLHPRR